MVQVSVRRNKTWWLPHALLYGSAVVVGFSLGAWLISVVGRMAA